ncbi:hypothetical protein M126_4120 [Bacteroides fragilis str. S6L3]|nr:hypothetical protein M074_3959 [Bacteroides fragilis str. DS-166]EYA03002.1 hypothetical protein M126_4120 [Bacteroides fragilis str. S6L3]EYA07594.1 hypothetical protein M130_4111 [Bacteroides fragilis str. S6R6]EYB03213.1 hypothetical protein M129_4133 [Bacteroides fragilis str. S6R5]EYE49744.1 hypothetical protein M131_3981 [Bacteroides fragilis str. S6R8]
MIPQKQNIILYAFLFDRGYFLIKYRLKNAFSDLLKRDNPLLAK